MSILQREPVRVYLYTVSLALVALLVATGVLTAGVAPLVLALVATVLAVPAVEVARSKVVPVEKVAKEIEAAYGIAAEGDRLVAGEGRDPSEVELVDGLPQDVDE